MPIAPENLVRWRLILGKSSEESFQKMGGCVGQSILSGEQGQLDEALEAIYSSDEIEQSEWEKPPTASPTAPSKAAPSRASPNGSIKSAPSFPKM